MRSYRHTLAASLLILIGAQVSLAQTSRPPAAVAPTPNMACSGNSQQWDNCVGIANYTNGNIYRGEFHHGQREGFGMLVVRAKGMPDENQISASEPGTIYAGEFRADHLNGHGMFLTPHGSYAGTFVNNIAQPDVAKKDCVGEPSGWTNCIAKLPFAGGNFFTGEVVRGARDGLGLLQINEKGVSDASGVRAPQQGFYVGQFKNGKLNGHGMVALQDGSGYSGTFTDNVLSSPAGPATTVRNAAAALARLMSDPVLPQQIIRTAANSTVQQQNPCQSAQFTIEKPATPYQQLTVDGTGRITAGGLKVMVGEQGCGSQRQLNVLLLADATGKVTASPLLPGNTRADALLQTDGLRTASTELQTLRGAIEPSCTNAYVEDTEYLEEDKGPPMPGARATPWRETWTFFACTRRLIVPMHFIPDATGTTIVPGPSPQIKVVPLTKDQQV